METMFQPMMLIGHVIFQPAENNSDYSFWKWICEILDLTFQQSSCLASLYTLHMYAF